jgi:hypothetical protein
LVTEAVKGRFDGVTSTDINVKGATRLSERYPRIINNTAGVE